MRWITADDLERWGKSLNARSILPALIGDLIRASSATIRSYRFPSGNKGQVRGFDGVLTAVEAPPYVPDGDSIWEFGTGNDAAGKADEDYEKRTRQVADATRAETTFVFVTTRTWDTPRQKLQEWMDTKKKGGEWKDVRYLDGVQIAEWLDQCSAVAARYARFELGLAPQTGATSIGEFWDEYSNVFDPPLAEAVLLCDIQVA
jgi:hypothetical protein